MHTAATPKDSPYVLSRPYSIITQETPTRHLQCRILLSDWAFISNLYPVPAAIEATITTLIHGITTELRRSGVSGWSTGNQRAFVAHIRRCAATPFARETIPRAEPGGSTDVGGAVEVPAQEPTAVIIETHRGDRDETLSPQTDFYPSESRKPFS